MNKWMLFALAGLLIACSDENEEPFVDPQISELSITQTIEGSSSVKKRTLYYDDGKLISLTIQQSLVPDISFVITADNDTYSYLCKWKGNNYSSYYSVEYTVDDTTLATDAKYVYQEGESRSYTMSYTTIDEKNYLKSIVESIKGVEYYALTFDYSRFASGEIALTQTLAGKERFWATLRITRNNKGGIPDVHLNDVDFHPLDKHIEAVYGGLFGSFDYFISQIDKETKTVVSTSNETITSSIEFDAYNYPHIITSVSDKSETIKRYTFEYKR